METTGHFDEEIDFAGHRAWTSRLRGSFRSLSSAFAASAQLHTWRIDSALGSEFKSCPPVAVSSELSSHQMAIRSHPGLQKMPANGISSELSAHQMAPPGAIAHSRGHLYPRASFPFVFLPRLATPALRLGVIGSFRPSELCVVTRPSLRTQVRPAIEFVSVKEGLRPRVAVFAGIASFCRTTLCYGYSSSSSSSTGTP